MGGASTTTSPSSPTFPNTAPVTPYSSASTRTMDELDAWKQEQLAAVMHKKEAAKRAKASRQDTQTFSEQDSALDTNASNSTYNDTFTVDSEPLSPTHRNNNNTTNQTNQNNNSDIDNNNTLSPNHTTHTNHKSRDTRSTSTLEDTNTNNTNPTSITNISATNIDSSDLSQPPSPTHSSQNPNTVNILPPTPIIPPSSSTLTQNLPELSQDPENSRHSRRRSFTAILLPAIPKLDIMAMMSTKEKARAGRRGSKNPTTNNNTNNTNNNNNTNAPNSPGPLVVDGGAKHKYLNSSNKKGDGKYYYAGEGVGVAKSPIARMRSNLKGLFVKQKSSQPREISTMFVSANVGSLFEVATLQPYWIAAFVAHLNSFPSANVIFIHFQEIGGKNWKTKDVQAEASSFFSRFEAAISEHFVSSGPLFRPPQVKEDSQFCALCTVCLVHKSLPTNTVKMRNFKTQNYIPHHRIRSHIKTHYEALTETQTFPRDKFPEYQTWSRKGFLHTQWLLKGHHIDVVNTHMFHDESNTAALSSSTYAMCRKRAFDLMLERITWHPDKLAVLFGDFNFRLNLESVLDMICNGNPRKMLKNSQLAEIEVRTEVGETLLSPILHLGKKLFKPRPKSFNFFTTDTSQLLQHDVERATVVDREDPGPTGLVFSELPINFAPTYPCHEGTPNASPSSMKYPYLATRCPSYCDRVFFSKQMERLISTERPAVYHVVGQHETMGDHKPVALLFQLV